MKYCKYLMLYYYLLIQIYGQSPTLYYSAFTTNDFTSNEGWTIMNQNQDNIFSECDGEKILGGYNILGLKASVILLLQLPPHNQIQIQLKFWRVDSWDGEHFQLLVDSQTLEDSSYTQTGSNVCGGYWVDQSYVIDQTISHTDDQVLIYLTSTLNQAANDESWGFRDFKLFLYLCDASNPCTVKETKDQCTISWLLLNSAIFLEPYMDGWVIVTSGIIENIQSEFYNACFNIQINKSTDIQKTKFISIRMKQEENQFYFNQLTKQIQFSLKQPDIVYLYFTQSQYYKQIDLSYPDTKPLIYYKKQENFIETSNQEIYQKVIQIKQITFQLGQICGNQIIEDYEQCDDGNFEPFDGCYNCEYSCNLGCSICIQGQCFKCQIGWKFDFLDNSCNSIQNDGLLQIDEECDVNISSDNCKLGKFSCPLNCIDCQFGICKICESNFILIDNTCQFTCQGLIFVLDQQCYDSNLYPFDQCHQCQSDNEIGCEVIIKGYCLKCLPNWRFNKLENNAKLQIKDLSIKQNTKHYYQYLILLMTCQIECINCQKAKCYSCIDGWFIQDFYCFHDDQEDRIYDEHFYMQQLIWQIGNDQACNEYCLVCKYNICLKCNNESQLMNNSCFKCGDGILNIQNEQCDDFNNNNKDGCSSNCQIEKGFYCQHNEQQQLEYCERCLDQNCLFCYKVDNYFTQYCKQCQQGYFMDNNGTCIKCNQICLECVKNQKNCIQYNYDYYQIKNCNSAQGLYYNFKLRDCDSKCGDGLMVKYEQCDDSNIYDYDGCNSKCEIEKGYMLDKLKNLILKEPNIQVINMKKSNREFSLFSTELQDAINCSATRLEIEQFQTINFNYTVFNLSESCNITLNYTKEINPSNLIHFIVQYKDQYQQSQFYNLTVNEVIQAPEKMIEYSQQQVKQGEQTASSSKSAQSSVLYLVPIAVLFGGLKFIWAILDIISWMNNFYFLNIQYPENVRLLFQQCDWGNIISIPQLNILNQPNDEYYFKSPEKFDEKGIDPLFLNNIQVVIIFFSQVVLTKLVCYCFRQIIQFFFLAKQQNIKTFQIFKMKSNLQIRNSQNVNQQSKAPRNIFKIPGFLKSLYNQCVQFEKELLGKCSPNILLAVLLQLCNQQKSGYFIVQINIFLAYLTLIALIIIIKISFQVCISHEEKLKTSIFQQRFSSLYEEIKIDTKAAMLYTFINLLRKTFFITSVVILYEFPIYQTAFCFCSCIINLFYLLTINPFSSKLVYIQNLIPDISILVIVANTIIYAFQDKFYLFSQQNIYNSGWIVIGCIILSFSIQLIFFVKEQVLSIIQILRQLIRYLKSVFKK